MYKVLQDFKDHLKENYEYKKGDTYEEINDMWTKFLVDRGLIALVDRSAIEKVEKKRGFFQKNEDIAEKQE